MQVKMSPSRDRTVADGIDQRCPVGLVRLFVELAREVEVIPADDHVLDEPSARLGDLL